MRYFAHISYLGVNYCGWQRQPNHKTVQQTIEEALQRLLKIPVICIGCGRTDSGVHALQYFFHFDVKSEIPDDFLLKINKMLPDDIAIHHLYKTDSSNHAQFSVVERTYEYFIHISKNPYLNLISAYYPFQLNVAQMQKAVMLLPRYTNYFQFCKAPNRVDDYHCNVKEAKLYISKNENRIRFKITANRFIAAMNRIIVHRLLEVGRGKLSVEEFEHMLSNSAEPKVIRQAYPQGLHLTRVIYPFLNLPPADFHILNENEYFWAELE
ncbi:MAG TPA: tRNA pseudouridine(38-40) synthase TruA [Salinivirgaceae bacterium]|nr:tRNA pseudouridine(38-40) synthase TruA [Salinivirgaceae bacterium]